jgi:cytochrome d ubiquinol oxidase subunit II
MLILVSFVLQAVSYEFQSKPGNIFGTKTYRRFLVFNGVFGPFLIGVAVATFFNGSNFIVNKASMGLVDNNTISYWANASHGLDALLESMESDFWICRHVSFSYGRVHCI